MGLGRRTFAPGEVLTASNVMNYLMDQTVMNFAGTAARGSAIGTAVQEGMLTYLNDSNLLEAYDGSAWKQLASTTGSILQVVSTTVQSSFSTTAVGYVDVTGVSVTITPKSATNRILVFVNGQSSNSDNSQAQSFMLLRGSTQIYVGTGGSSNVSSLVYAANSFRVDTFALNHLDSPATTSPTTYKLQLRRESGGTAFVGRRGSDTSFGMPTTITVMEVVA